MQHGVKSTFEIVGEKQVIAGQSQEPEHLGFRFGRIFQTLPPFRPTDASLTALGAEMTKPFNPATPSTPDGSIPSGYTYFGQFVDHDITKDTTPGLPQDAPLAGVDPDTIKQARSPSLDLDSLYGKPDVADPKLMAGDGIHFLLGQTTPTPSFGTPADMSFPGHDLPRAAIGADRGRANIGDDRNDENLIIQQIHLAFLKFHNKAVDHFRAAAPDASNTVVFAQARDIVTRHYQWIVLNDFVRRIVSPQTFRSVLGVQDLSGAASITPNPLIFKVSGAQIPPMPLEFSAAAYRFGHSMVRDEYNWNRFFGSGTTFDLFFLFTNLSGDIGKKPIFGLELNTFPSNWIADWRRMFEMETVAGFPAFSRTQAPLNLARKIDTHLATELGKLPFGGGNLAARNLIRGSRNGLPSGQDVAAAIVAAGDKTAKPMSPADVLRGLDPAAQKVLTDFDFQLKTPLWFYILKEAENAGGGMLGPVGSRIVLETFLALIRASVISIFNGDVDNPADLTVFDPSTSPLRTDGGEAIETMPQLLAFVGDVNPLG
jgi:hypothetical protein